MPDRPWCSEPFPSTGGQSKPWLLQYRSRAVLPHLFHRPPLLKLGLRGPNNEGEDACLTDA